MVKVRKWVSGCVPLTRRLGDFDPSLSALLGQELDALVAADDVAALRAAVEQVTPSSGRNARPASRTSRHTSGASEFFVSRRQDSWRICWYNCRLIGCFAWFHWLTGLVDMVGLTGLVELIG